MHDGKKRNGTNMTRRAWERFAFLYDAQSRGTIRLPKAAIVCSDCRNAFKKDALWKRNSCPNCGAKMDGGAGNAVDRRRLGT